MYNVNVGRHSFFMLNVSLIAILEIMIMIWFPFHNNMNCYLIVTQSSICAACHTPKQWEYNAWLLFICIQHNYPSRFAR